MKTPRTKPAHLLRILWLEAYASSRKQFTRADYIRAWELSGTVATEDFRKLMELRPGCIEYRQKDLAYFWIGKGKPLDSGPVEQILKYLPR